MRTFIHKDVIDPKICKEIIKFFEKNKKTAVKGKSDLSRSDCVNVDCKDSKDISIEPNLNIPPFNKYFKQQQLCLNNYMSIYQELNFNLAPFKICENVNIQKYEGLGGFKKSHCERSNYQSSNRLLVFMTYLNNAKNGGTYFKYQDYKTEAIQGDTYIWPSEWTHMHSGIVTKEVKYIITGWYNFFN
jgi:hypothetical protein